MTHGWRNRFRAPVSALVISLAISFVLVIILGATLNNPNNPTRIQFKIVGQSGVSEPAKELEGRDVTVSTNKRKKLLAQGKLNQSGEFTLPTPDDDIQICTRLQEGQFAVDPKLTDADGNSCWDRVPGEYVEIALVRREG